MKKNSDLQKRNHAILGVITARGGSVGIPGKNIKHLGGKPLIAWSIEACAVSKKITDLIISTDSEEIAAVAKKLGGDVPFIRPASLAQNETPHAPVMQHAVREMEKEKNITYDYVVIIQPTSPFREPQYIDDLIDLTSKEQVNSGVTVYQIDEKHHPVKMKKMVGNRIIDYSSEYVESLSGTRRQDLPPAYKRSGDVYVIARDYLMETGKLYSDDMVGYVVNAEKVIDIDTMKDWEIAEEIAEKIAKNSKN